jgi:hypothetical protein
MKKPMIFYPFILAIYPILGLYSQNPGTLMIDSIFRPIVVAIILTGLATFLFHLHTRDWQHAALLSALTIFYLSSSGHVYRIIKTSYLKDAGPLLHEWIVIVELTLVAILTINSIRQRVFTQKRITAITHYLNLFSSIVIPMIPIVGFFIKSYDDAPVSWTQYIGKGDGSQQLSVEYRPDVYLIVLDGYGRSDVLKDIYGLDNSNFLNALTDRGFYIAKKSRSNYVQTSLSFSSFLNFDYINFTEDLAGKDSINRIPLISLIRENRARNLLTQAGYRFVSTDTGYLFTSIKNSDVYLSPDQTSTSGFEQFLLSTTALNALYSSGFPFVDTFQKYIPILNYSFLRERVVYPLDQLEHTIPSMPGPKFVYVHVVSPHPPFIFDQYGNVLEPDRPYTPGDGTDIIESAEKYQELYANQVLYVNKRTIAVVDAIMAESRQAPIIIIQGDHGPGSLMSDDNLDHTCIFERTSILNAYYFPGGKTTGLYPTVTPVNSFRILFNTFFGTHYKLLPDRTYYSPQGRPYDFIDVTDWPSTTDPCQ